MSVELNEALLQKAAGWDVVKRARAYLQLGQVLSSYWQPPLLRGVVQNDGVSFRASMVIKNEIDIENLCTCREAREWGKICAHAVAVGLHWLKGQKAEATAIAPKSVSKPGSTVTPNKKLPTLVRDPAGEPAGGGLAVRRGADRRWVAPLGPRGAERGDHRIGRRVGRGADREVDAATLVGRSHDT